MILKNENQNLQKDLILVKRKKNPLNSTGF